MRPTCCNHGCSKGVCCNTGKLSDPNPRYRPVCGHCQGANYGKHPYAKGVTPFVTGQCSNSDGHLGFECWTDFSKMPADFKGRTHIDHRDGNPHNNVLENLDELCVSCHAYKSQRNGDTNGWRTSSRRFTIV
jgi:hypothetical protein